ncbi:MAG TPA: hypothetical protein VMT99_01985 [Candidatus Paceibacterota bacterium]|nr:hypothetical protein [Candidatus Paceibacterota bacterium]
MSGGSKQLIGIVVIALCIVGVVWYAGSTSKTLTLTSGKAVSDAATTTAQAGGATGTTALATGTTATTTTTTTTTTAQTGSHQGATPTGAGKPLTFTPTSSEILAMMADGTSQAPFGTEPAGTALDTAAYDAKMTTIADVPVKKVTVTSTVQFGTSTIVMTTTTYKKLVSGWPVAGAPYPLPGALLPFNRIVAYYGNFYSTQMGILGEFAPDVVMAKLASTSAMWAAADPSTPVIPALDYIVVSAQGSPGPDGKYRLRMPPDQVQKAIDMANALHGIVFLDVQVGLSSVETEVPLLAQYLKLPNVELSIDPEFAMHNGRQPGTVIGTLDASNIDFAARYLATIVHDNNLPPKILVVHRFTQAMVTNYKDITPLPEVQVVMDMDGFGPPSQKIGTYQDFIEPEPVQFTGFKIFYKNDVKVPGSYLLGPAQLLKLTPEPSYIQYQ